MKLFSIALFFTSLAGLSFLIDDGRTETKGVYIISVVSAGQKSFRFPDDSLFICKGSVVEKILRIDETFLDNNKTAAKESLDRYYVIDFKKGLCRDAGKNLKKAVLNTKLIPLKNKEYGMDFSIIWHNDEKYKIKDTVFNGKKVKKIQYQNKKGVRYEVLMSTNSSREQFPVFFKGIEDKFKADVIKIFVTYPGEKGSWVYTKKFVSLKNHEILMAMDRLK